MSKSNLPAGYIVCPRPGHDRAFRPADGCPVCARLSRAVRLVECLERAAELPAGTAAKARSAAAAPPPALDRGAAPQATPRPARAPRLAPADTAANRRAAPWRSKLEAQYAAYLDECKAAGLVRWWLYERLPALPINETVDGDGKRKTRRYKTDFLVALPAPGAQHPLAIVPCVDEVKGEMHRGRDRGIAKWDASANRYPYLIHRLIERDGNRWRVSVAQPIGAGSYHPTTAAPAPQPKGAKRCP